MTERATLAGGCFWGMLKRMKLPLATDGELQQLVPKNLIQLAI